MASDSRALTLKLLADVADYQRKLDQSEKVTDGFSGKVQDFGKKAAAAFAVAGAAAAAYAGKLLVDGVKAAIADEAAQTKLAASLRNATDATEAQIKSTEEYITKTSIAVGVTDDELRPSLQRLAIATGDVTKAQNLQKLALDVSAGSGKSLETVSNALARAYEGNTASLGRLGIGLSTAELKTMTFDEVTNQLSNTFKNQATIQADTFQGKLTRLQIGFDEAKEAIGSRLLPILTNFLNILTNQIIPAGQQLIDKFRPLTKAVEDNKDEFTALWKFLDKYILPILTGALKIAFQGIVTSITTMVNAVGKAINFFQDLYDKYKKFIDFIKNNPLSQFLGKINPFSNTSFETSALINTSNEVDELGRPVFINAGGGGSGGGGSGGGGQGTGSNIELEGTLGGPKVYTARGRKILVPAGLNETDAQAYADGIAARADRTDELINTTAEIRARIAARKAGNANTDSTATTGNVTINVNAPTVIDEEGFTRAVVSALNNSTNRGTTGAGDLRTNAQIL